MAATSGPFELPPLPYAIDALAPHISAETLEFHWGRHQRGYVNTLNNIVATSRPDLANKTLEEILKTEKPGKPYNQAAQIWNHTFYWNSMKPNGGGMPGSKLLERITADIGSYDKFKEQFTEAAVSHFGSGWAWLIKDKDGKLKVIGTHDAFNPITDGQQPILTCDVWEHAYYIDYRNERAKYVNSWWSLVNWEFAEKNL